MAAVELATAYVTLAVSTEKGAKQVKNMFAGAGAEASKAGRTMGKSMQTAFKAAKPLDVKDATKNLEDAQKRLTLATEKSAAKQKKAQEDVAAARQKLADVASKAGQRVEASADKVADAEKGVAQAAERAASDQEAAKRKVEIAQARYNEVLRDHAPESAKALAAADQLARAEENLSRVTQKGSDQQEAAKRKLADAQEEYARAVEESGKDSDAARKAADELTLAEQKLEAASMEAADEHGRLSEEVDKAKRSLEKAEKASGGLSRAWGGVKQAASDYKGLGDSLNKAVGPKLWGGIKAGAVGAAGAVVGTLGGALVKGWGRLTSIENAESKLAGLGHSAESVSAIMENALGAVKGTAFGMDEAAGLAGTLVASGIEPGKELERILSLTADSATIAGRELGDMGLIWGSVAAKGKLQGDDAMQLLASGVPIWQMVGDVMGVTAGEAQKLGTDGKVSFDIFAEAMEKGIGGAAQEAGNTTQGAFKNMGAAMGRFGAAILKDVYPLVGPLFGKITDLFDYLTDAAAPVMESLSGKLAEFGKGIKGVWDILVNGDFTGAENLFGFEEDSGFVTFLFGVRDVAIALYEKALKPLGTWVADNWQLVAGALGGLVAFFAGSMLVSAIAAIGGAIVALVGGISWAVFAVGALAAAIGAFFTGTDTGRAILDKFKSFVVDEVVPRVVGAFELVRDFVVGELWPMFKSRFEAIRDLVVQVWQGIIQPAFEQFAGFITGTLWPIVKRVFGDYIGPLIAGVWLFVIKPAMAAMDWFIGKVLGPVLIWLWKNVVSPVFKAIGAVFDFTFNGIIFPLIDGLVALFVDYLAPAAVWLWKNVLKPAWDGIGAAIGAVVGWVKDTALPWIVDAWDAIAGGASAMYEDGVKPAWSGISDAISAVVDWVTGTAVPWLQSAWDVIGSALRWLYENIVRPVWDGIRIAIAIAATAIMVTIDLLVWVYRKVLAPVFTWLYEKVVKPVWNAIKTVIQVVVAWFRDTAWPLIKVAIDWIGAAFVWLRDKLKGVWAWIRDKVIAPVVAWFRDTVWPIFEKVIEWLGKKFEHFRIRLGIVWGLVQAAIKAVVVWFRDTAWPILRKVIDWIKQWFENLKNNLKRIWSFIKNNVINPVVAWFRDTAWPVVRSIIDKLKNAFQSLRDRLKAIWDAIKTKIIKPVVDWIVGTAWKKLDDFIGKAKSGFDNLKESVLKAWDKIKEGMKEPINGVIRIYNKHIAGNFNKVIETIFGEEGAKKYKIGTMNEFARGGWTGPGSKYQEAGIVHADEFVIRKESQNDLARRAPGFLDSLNRYGSRALGYANGGLVKLRMPFAGSYPRGDGFGARGGKHDGIDWPMPHGAVLKAVGAGTVKHTRNPAAGKKLEIQLGNGLVAGYHHLSSYIAKAGASVGRGADVARVGSTGRSSGPHLHFSLKRDGKYVDPAPYLGAGGEAGDGSGGGIWNPFSGLWSKIKSKVTDAVGGGVFGSMLSGITENTVDGIKGWVTDQITAVGDWGMEQVDSATRAVKTARWLPVARRALDMEGELTKPNLDSLMRRMNQESGFNPRAVNDWDSNAKRGTPSKGLMQVIGPTFRAYARPGFDKDIFDPLSNILASIRYTRATYGSLKRGWDRKGGYADGGLVKPFLHDSGGWHLPGELSVNQTRKPEAVLTNEQWAMVSRLAEQNLAVDRGPSIHIENAGLSPADVVDEMERRQRRARSLRRRAFA